MKLLSVDRCLPGLRQLRGYRREWLHSDLAAGVSVAAVAVPTAIAYAQLIGSDGLEYWTRSGLLSCSIRSIRQATRSSPRKRSRGHDQDLRSSETTYRARTV